MKCSLALISLAAVGGLTLSSLSGCETVTETAGQNGNRVNRVVSIDALQIPDDVEELLLLDHPSWLSRKPMPAY